MQKRLKTNAQIKCIFGLAKKRGVELDDDTKAGMAATASAGRVGRLSLLSFDEANVVIKNLGGDPIRSGGNTPRRTLNHHKQMTGVTTLASPAALAQMERLAEGRGISADGLARMCNKTIKKPYPRTAQECSKIIEALKAMNARDKEAA